jgi:hypothetical protein
MNNVAFTLSLSRWGYWQLYALWWCHAYILSPSCLQYEIFIVLWSTNMQSILLFLNHVGLRRLKLFIEVSSWTCWPWAGNIAGWWLECWLATVHWGDICMLWASRKVLSTGWGVCLPFILSLPSFGEAYSKNLQLCVVSVNMQGVPGGKVNFLRGHSIHHSKQKVYMYMCPILNSDLY